MNDSTEPFGRRVRFAQPTTERPPHYSFASVVAVVAAFLSVVCCVAAASSDVGASTLCPLLEEMRLPPNGVDAILPKALSGLIKGVKSWSFKNGGTSLGAPRRLMDFTPCINFGKMCPVELVVWLLAHSEASALLGGSDVVASWEGSLVAYVSEKLRARCDHDGECNVVVTMEDITACISPPASEEGDGSTARGGAVSVAGVDSIPVDLHERVQRDLVSDSIRTLQGRVAAFKERAYRGGEVLGAAPPATLCRLLPPWYLHRWSDLLGYFQSFLNVAVLPIVLSTSGLWCWTWIQCGGSRYLWGWVDRHRNADSPEDRVHMVVVAARWGRLNVLGAVYRAHLLACLLPLLYYTFIAYNLCSEFGASSILSILVSPSLSPLAIVLGLVGGGILLGGGFLVLLVKDVVVAWADSRKLGDFIEAG